MITETGSPSIFQRLRQNIHAIEATEFVALTLILGALWTAIMVVYGLSEGEWVGAISLACLSPVGLLAALFILWGSYLLYIRLARWGGPLVDVGLWVLMAFITSSATFWVWSVLDVNRWIMSKLFYRGEAPLEYAWSQASKRRRKEWEQARKSQATWPVNVTSPAAPIGDTSVGEQTIKEGPANHWRGAESVGGHLWLTTSRLYFKSHGLNVQTHEVSFPIWQINSAETSSTLGVVPNGLTIVLQDGRQERFVVNDRDDWVAKIRQLGSGM